MTAKKHSKKKSAGVIAKKAFSFSIMLSLLLVVSLKMYQSFTIDLLMKDLRTLSKQKEKLQSETARLQADVDRLQNYDRISRIASNKLGLEANTDKVYVLQLKEMDMMKHLAEKEKQTQSKKYQVAGVQ